MKYVISIHINKDQMFYVKHDKPFLYTLVEDKNKAFYSDSPEEMLKHIMYINDLYPRNIFTFGLDIIVE